MTTVLPEPVAILKAIRGQAGVGLFVRLAKLILNPGIAVLLGYLGDVDGRLQGFNLTEKKLALAFRLGPILQELACRRRYAEISTVAPHANALADVVDELVFFDAVLCPLGVEERLLCSALLLFRACNGHEIGADAALAFDDLVGDALVGKTKMAGRVVEGRVDDWVFDDDLAHSVPVLCMLHRMLADPHAARWPYCTHAKLALLAGGTRSHSPCRPSATRPTSRRC